MKKNILISVIAVCTIIYLLSCKPVDKKKLIIERLKEVKGELNKIDDSLRIVMSLMVGNSYTHGKPPDTVLSKT